MTNICAADERQDASLEGRSPTAVPRLVGPAKMHLAQRPSLSIFPSVRTVPTHRPAINIPLKLTNLVFSVTAVLEQVFLAWSLIGITPPAAR